MFIIVVEVGDLEYLGPEVQVRLVDTMDIPYFDRNLDTGLDLEVHLQVTQIPDEEVFDDLD